MNFKIKTDEIKKLADKVNAPTAKIKTPTLVNINIRSNPLNVLR